MMLLLEYVKPPLRVDCAYAARSRHREQAGIFVIHVEVETGLALKGIKVVPNEEAARVLLDLLAA